ncbi:protein PARALOG OF AIPP2 [Lycium barbarum]|uniref:protein PARALOG OF AIPP2 n=1 Tax=Lycium barbarum TaxID=112863 RepID=UPI00293E50CB|nr:protein PARALOG OF AIPP2 [Lycium barbarum]
MVDLQKVCSMCGDVGFPEKIFRCSKCHHRYQHSYCSNYYSEMSGGIEVCDWCQSEEKHSNSRRGSSSRKSATEGITMSSRSEYSGGDKIKQQHHDHHNHREESTAHDQKPKNNHGGAPSPRTSTRRYKLLKDVMC